VLAIDYAWTHPDPGAIKRAGYKGVFRYLSHDASKDATVSEVKALHRAGLWVALVWEATANRAAQGVKAGRADVKDAEKMARALGYPKDCVIFYAVDFDAEPKVVTPYFHGIKADASYHVGAYGSLRIVDHLMTNRHVGYGWQTVAWSNGALSEYAHVFQRAKATYHIAGARGGWDEDVILKAFPVWSPKPSVAPKPPAPAHPTPAPENPDHDLLVAFQKWSHDKGLTP
jgi:hypothetical protein